MNLSNLKDVTLLYVEDEEETREQMLHYLKRKVKDVLSAADGKEGLSLFNSHRPDIVITDSRMPVMDGIAMARFIKSDSPATPIIVVTAFNAEECEEDHNEPPTYDRYLMKPVDMKDLLHTMSELLNISE